MLPICCWGKSLQLDYRASTGDLVRDLKHAVKTNQCTCIDFISFQQFLAVAEVAQEPGEPPQQLGRAVEAGRDGAADERFRLQHVKTQLIKRLLLMPTVLSALYPDQV